MKTPINLATLSFALAVTFTSPTFAADTAKPNADQILKQMGKKIGGARQFTFKAHREMDASLEPGRDTPEDARIEVSVSRPNKAAGKASSKDGVRRVYADGQNFTLLDAKKNLYSTVPMHTSLDGLVDVLDAKYGFVPPLANFMVSDPYKEIRSNAQTVSYLGQGTYSTGFLGLSKVECHRLALKGKVADAELWIGVNDQLPRKLVATFRDRPGQPQLKIEFSAWNLDARTTDQDFALVPPQGAVKIPMRTTAGMEAAMNKAEHRKK